MFWQILKNFALQNLVTIGAIVLFGFIIALCNKRFYRNFGSHGTAVCYVTGVIGTPVHECSHALMCLIFGHKIVEMKLFQIGDDGTLGYVAHTYRKRNVYQRMGNFFIGVAPIIVISAILFGFSYLLMPDMIRSLNANSNLNSAFSSFGGFFSYLWSVIKAFFVEAKTWQWWVFILIGSFLCLHMTLSRADIASAWGGFVLVIIISLLFNIILGLIKLDWLEVCTYHIVRAGSILVSMLLLSLFISLIAVAFSYLLRLIFFRRG